MRAMYKLRRNTIGSVKLRVMGRTRAMRTIWMYESVGKLARIGSM